MSPRTAFLGRLIGLYCILVPLSLAVHREASVDMVNMLIHNPPTLLLLGVTALAVGLAIILGHNLWKGGPLPVIVTLVGWISLTKGLLFLFLSPEEEVDLMRALHYEQPFYVYSAVTILIGLYLTYGSFRFASHSVARRRAGKEEEAHAR